MPLKKVGQNISAKEYWEKRGESYRQAMMGTYGIHRKAMIDALLKDIDLQGKVVLDFGCGEGIFLDQCARQGATVIGYDIDEEMVKVAQERLKEAGLSGQVEVAHIEILENLAPDSVDVVLALNVLAYFTHEEEKTFYEQVARFLRPQGQLIITHSNELFDLYTLNAYTVEFFANHFSVEKDQSATLLAHPNKPERVTFNIRENPLAYRHKLAHYGLEEIQQEFANYHPIPPLLMPAHVFEDAHLHEREYLNTLDWDASERWKLMFMCSMFGSRSTRQ